MFQNDRSTFIMSKSELLDFVRFCLKNYKSIFIIVPIFDVMITTKQTNYIISNCGVELQRHAASFTNLNIFMIFYQLNTFLTIQIICLKIATIRCMK